MQPDTAMKPKLKALDSRNMVITTTLFNTAQSANTYTATISKE